MKAITVAIFISLSTIFASFGQKTVSTGNYKVPASDYEYSRTKSWIEEDIDTRYQHASSAAIEAFRDIKYGVRIHWGLYSINGQGDTSWPFLKLSFAQKQAYNEMYKIWNPTGFNADEWVKFFKENGLKMFAITANHHEGFSMFDTKARVKKRV